MMMILLKKIQLNNFLSHEDTTIDFSDRESTLIDGASGAGKSSIFDAIVFALYGVGRSDNRSLVKRGSKKSSVCLELKKDDEIIIINRSITSAGKHHLSISTEKNGVKTAFPISTGIRELQAWIDKDLIGASYLLFVNSVAYVQGNTENFVVQTAPKRKELLLEIIKAEDYDNYYENAKEKLSSLANERSALIGQTSEVESRIKILKDGLKEKETYIKIISDNSIILSKIEPQIEELESQRIKYLSINQNLINLESTYNISVREMALTSAEISKITTKIATKSNLIKELSTVEPTKKLLDIAKENSLLLRNKLSSATKIQEERNEVLKRKPVINDKIFQEIKYLENRIEKLQKDPICPSGKDCPYYGDHLKEIEKIEDQINKNKEMAEKEASALANWSIEFSNLPEEVDISKMIKEVSLAESEIFQIGSSLLNLEAVQKELDSIIAIEGELPRLNEKLEKQKKDVETAKFNKENIEKMLDKQEMNRITDDIVCKKHERDIIKEDIARATAMLENISSMEDELKTLQERLIVIKKKDLVEIDNKFRKVELVKQAFGSKGIETMVIDFVLPKLEDKINEILGKMSDFRIRLDTQKKSADGESTIEGLFITIINEVNEELPFETYSGGEKLKISVSISEALASLQKVGFRLFDETFIGLDENSTESFARVLGSLQNNFSQVLCISHLLQIKELLDKKINIIKNKGISYVN